MMASISRQRLYLHLESWSFSVHHINKTPLSLSEHAVGFIWMVCHVILNNMHYSVKSSKLNHFVIHNVDRAPQAGETLVPGWTGNRRTQNSCLSGPKPVNFLQKPLFTLLCIRKWVSLVAYHTIKQRHNNRGQYKVYSMPPKHILCRGGLQVSWSGSRRLRVWLSFDWWTLTFKALKLSKCHTADVRAGLQLWMGGASMISLSWMSRVYFKHTPNKHIRDSLSHDRSVYLFCILPSTINALWTVWNCKWSMFFKNISVLIGLRAFVIHQTIT